MNSSEPRYITPNQAAMMLGVTGEAVKSWIYKGRLPAIKLSNGYWKINAEHLQQFLHERSIEVAPYVLLYCRRESASALAKAIEASAAKSVVAHNALDAALKFRGRRFAAAIIEIANDDDVADTLKMIFQDQLKKIPVLLVSKHKLAGVQLKDALKCRAGACVRLDDERALQSELRRLLKRRD